MQPFVQVTGRRRVKLDNNSKTTGVIVYARVSTDRQEEAGTIESQLDAISHHPLLQGREIAEIYSDDGVSGYFKPLWERPAGQRLLQDAESGKWRGHDLLTYSVKRLGRRSREVDEAIDKLMAAGIAVVCVQDGFRFDNQTPMLRFTRQLLGSLAELDRNVIVETSRTGMVRKAREGTLLPSYARLGYDWSKTDDRGFKMPGARLVVNESEAALVRTIFEKLPQMTTKRVVVWLNENGHRLPCKSPRLREKYGRTTRLFSAKAVTDIATDELYTGTVSWGKTTKMLGQKPEEFRHHFPELQIVTFEAFRKAQEALRDRRRVPSKSQGSPYIFSGLVRCPVCGGRTVGKRQWHAAFKGKPETRRYCCRAYEVHGKVACKGWNAFEQTIMKAVIPFLTDVLENKLAIRGHLRSAADEMQRESGGRNHQALQAQIVDAERMIRKTQEGYELDLYTGEEARLKILEARERKERAERQLAAVQETREMREELSRALKLLERPLGEFLESMEPLQLARLCRMVFKKFTIHAEGYGWERRAAMTSYEFTPMVQQALADSLSSSFHIESTTPAFDMV